MVLHHRWRIRIARDQPFPADLCSGRKRIADMRKLALALIAVPALVAAASTAGVDRGAPRTEVGGAISIQVPTGWHLIRNSITDVIDPIPRLAIASFAVRLSPRPCECGMPNISHFPRTGAFLFIWEYPHLAGRALERFPRRPPSFRITSTSPQEPTCQGPSGAILFRSAGGAFQAEIYLGPAAGPDSRARLVAAMNSLRIPFARTSSTAATVPEESLMRPRAAARGRRPRA
jgi:hypothetical protein